VRAWEGRRMEKIKNQQTNYPLEGCPKCGASEVPANSPRTKYNCGSSDYDQRPNTFMQSEECLTNIELNK